MAYKIVDADVVGASHEEQRLLRMECNGHHAALVLPEGILCRFLRELMHHDGLHSLPGHHERRSGACSTRNCMQRLPSVAVPLSMMSSVEGAYTQTHMSVACRCDSRKVVSTAVPCERCEALLMWQHKPHAFSLWHTE